MDLLNLLVKITADSSDAEKQVSGFAGKAGKAIGGIARVGGAAIAAGGAAVVAVTKQAMDGYSEYEQLAGGIQTLYGENSKAADDMMQHASEAWKTSGMSANQYMETAIQSSASMISSLGGDTEKAAQLMDMSIIDMSDNVNKMGTSMEAVQNAYRGFSRGNFTMLDNLALGFAGTKEGMQELLDKAEELTGVKFDISSYSDIVEAIHAVQDSMGIAGTTAKEATETIQGSLSAAKSAWSNLVTGIADENSNLDELVANFVESIGKVGDNVLPRVEQILQGVGTAVEKLAPQLAEGAVSLITNVSPDLIKAASSLVMAIIKAIIDNLPKILDAGIEIIFALIDGMIEALPELIPAVVKVILTIVEKLTEPNMLMKLIEAAIQIIEAIAQGLINAIPELVKTAPTIIMNLVEAILRLVPQLVASGIELMANLALGIIEGGAKVIQGVVELLGELKEKFLERVENARQWGADLINNFIGGITSKIGNLWSTVKSIGSGIKNMLGFSEPKEGPLSDFHTYAPDMMKLFAQGIKDNEHLVTDQIRSSFDFGDLTTGATPAVAGGAGSTTNTYNITVNGIEELEELLRWYESRQVRARMA